MDDFAHPWRYADELTAMMRQIRRAMLRLRIWHRERKAMAAIRKEAAKRYPGCEASQLKYIVERRMPVMIELAIREQMDARRVTTGKTNK